VGALEGRRDKLQITRDPGAGGFAERSGRSIGCAQTGRVDGEMLSRLAEVFGEDPGVTLGNDVPAESEHPVLVRTAVVGPLSSRCSCDARRRGPTRHQAAARSANFAYRRKNESLTVSVGPFLCFATCTSARPCWSDSAS
jgi:hypothetical protein